MQHYLAKDERWDKRWKQKSACRLCFNLAKSCAKYRLAFMYCMFKSV